MPVLALCMLQEAIVGDGAVFGRKEPRRSRSGQQYWKLALALRMPIQGTIGGGAVFGGKEPGHCRNGRHEWSISLGAFPFDIACHQEASLEVLRVLVERTPATVKMTGGGEELLLPLHFTCSHRAGLYSLQYLLGIDPSAVETTNNDGNIQQPGIIEGVAGFNRNGPSLC
jgi:hypothetical protein